MNKVNFVNLIQQVTGRNFFIKTNDAELMTETKYVIIKHLPLTESYVRFEWVTPKNEDKFLRSFITTFTSKYREPNPQAYDYKAKIYGEQYLWVNMSDIDKEYAYCHHSNNMFSKETLLKQVEANFSKPNIESVLIKYGFYATEYGTGIFAFWQTEYVNKAIEKMANFLKSKNIPYKNEFSEARWVFRFKLNIDKNIHTNLLNEFSCNF